MTTNLMITEIFPTRIREPGVAFGVGSQWLFNFIWSFATPYIMDGIGWATFLLFGLLDILILAFTIFCLKETANKTLEEINEMFEGIDPHAEAGWKGADDVLEEEEIEPRHSNGHADGGGAGRYRDGDGGESIHTAESDGNKNHATHLEESTAGRA